MGNIHTGPWIPRKRGKKALKKKKKSGAEFYQRHPRGLTSIKEPEDKGLEKKKGKGLLRGFA